MTIQSIFLIVMGTVFVIFYRPLARLSVSYHSQILKVRPQAGVVKFMEVMALIVGTSFVVVGTLDIMGVVDIR